MNDANDILRLLDRARKASSAAPDVFRLAFDYRTDLFERPRVRKTESDKA